ncbi:ATP synthase subunit I [Methanothermococcus okinawensis]|uniref:Uncharacterized protein n=1 Tax=Methanothermococcus okinawensis (strain DSM 14208 / JCM 11175 / IH1) TaxID=647113 RepID=F8AKM1_METOI|nr:ATP synthase subunit I [Methanothermococcus okinawensis]AEH06354.1 hypothetical protein Metok_0365 [Methanothermococcus okinawensis IH1]
MEEVKKNVDNITYQYDWKYEVFLSLKSFLLKFLKVAIVLIVLYYILKFAPFWLFSILLGSIIFFFPVYLFVKSFFKVDYLVFLHVDLEKRSITPYYFPKKLFLSGEWEIVGLKKKYISRIEFAGSIKELEKLFKEVRELEAEIKAKEKVVDDLEKVIFYYKALKKITKKRIKKAYRKAIGKEKTNYKEYNKIVDEYMSARERYEQLKDEINELKNYKNELLESLSFTGEDGGIVWLVDRIDWENKKIFFSDVHMFSEIEFLTNANVFKEMNEKISNMYVEYSKLKNAFASEVTKTVSKLINIYMKDLKPEVSEFELDKLEKIEEEDIIEEDNKQLQELIKMLGDVNGRIYEGVGKVDNTSKVSEPAP